MLGVIEGEGEVGAVSEDAHGALLVLLPELLPPPPLPPVWAVATSVTPAMRRTKRIARIGKMVLWMDFAAFGSVALPMMNRSCPHGPALIRGTCICYRVDLARTTQVSHRSP